MNIANSSLRARPVVVVGGGVAGLTVAWELGTRGLEVCVVERGSIGAREPWGSATASSVGVLSVPKRGRSPLKRLQTASRLLYPSFVARLQEASGVDPGYRVPGSLHLVEALPPHGVQEKKAQVYRDAGVDCRWVAGRELEAVCPGLGARFRAALYLPSEAIVDPQRLLLALRTACERRGVILRENAGSARLETESGRTVLRLEGGETVRDATFVVSAGAWSGGVAAALLPPGEAARAPMEEHPGLPIRPIRGQALALRLDRELGPNLRFRPRDMERDYHVITREGATRWVGSTVEDVGFDGQVTEAGACELLRAAHDALGDVALCEVTDRWAGLRPQARRPGGPFLGPLFSAADVWMHCAHYRSGILLAPLTAKLLCDGMLGEDDSETVGVAGPIPRASEIIDALRPTPSTAG